MECWAKELGGCKGPQSGEHIVSKSLFKGKMIKVRGFPFCRTDPVTISLASATSNILCAYHNNALSETDQAIANFQEAITRMNRRPQLTKDGRLRKPPERIEVSGKHLSRWLAKTYCNTMAVAKRNVDPRMISYSFGRLPASPLHTYVNGFQGMRANPKPGQISAQDFFDEQGNVVFSVRVAGFILVVSTIELSTIGENFYIGDQLVPTRNFLTLPCALEMKHRLSSGRDVMTTVVHITGTDDAGKEEPRSTHQR